jgi:hypothetical protein
MTTQTKFTDTMRRLAEERDLDLLVNTNWANTGRFVFQHHDQFDPLLEFPYAFHPDYASFNGGGGDGPLGRSATDGPWSYVQGGDLNRLVERITELLDERLAQGGEAAFDRALAAFKRAALSLERTWEGQSVNEYPAYLPDFSEFAIDIQKIERFEDRDGR